MMTIEKTYGVRGIEDDRTFLRIQEIIAITKEKLGFVGKVVIDTEKITYYKFGLKLGISRLATNGIVVNERGVLRDTGFFIPELHDRQILTDLYALFGERCPI